MKNYSNAEIMEKKDELSIVMMISKLQKAADYAGQVKERPMGELFANFEAYDVQATRREAREEGIEQGMAQGRQEGIEKGIVHSIKMMKEARVSREVTKQQLMKQFEISSEAAEENLKQHW